MAIRRSTHRLVLVNIKYSLATLNASRCYCNSKAAFYQFPKERVPLYANQDGPYHWEEKVDSLRQLVRLDRTVSEQDIRDFINTYKDTLISPDIGMMMHGMAKKRIRLDNETMKFCAEVLHYKTRKVNLIHVVKCFQGLRCFRDDADSAVINLYLAYLTRILDNKTVQLDFTSQAVGNCFFALQRIDSNQEGVDDLLDMLHDALSSCKQQLNSQEIGNALYGLQRMYGSGRSVREVLSVMSEKVRLSEAVLDNQAIGNALYGLQCMDSNEKEVQEMLWVMSEKIRESDAVLSGQTIGNALYGLRCASSKEQEVRDVLSALSEKISKTTAPMDWQNLGMAMYGLRGMCSRDAEVRTMLSALSCKIRESGSEMDEQAIGMTVYGLQRMKSTVAEVR